MKNILTITALGFLLLGCGNFVKQSEFTTFRNYSEYSQTKTRRLVENAYVCSHYLTVANTMYNVCDLQGPQKSPDACLFADTYIEVCMESDVAPSGNALLSVPERNFQVIFNKRLKKLKEKSE